MAFFRVKEILEGYWISFFVGFDSWPMMLLLLEAETSALFGEDSASSWLILEEVNNLAWNLWITFHRFFRYYCRLCLSEVAVQRSKFNLPTRLVQGVCYS